MSADPKLVDVEVVVPTAVENPFLVYGADGKLLGSAVITPSADRLYVRLILDPHNPESFDLVGEPGRCTVDVRSKVEGGVMRGTVILTSK